MGLLVRWSKQMMKFEGYPVKPVSFRLNGVDKKGKFVITKNGIEGVSYIYFLLIRKEK